MPENQCITVLPELPATQNKEAIKMSRWDEWLPRGKLELCDRRHGGGVDADGRPEGGSEWPVLDNMVHCLRPPLTDGAPIIGDNILDEEVNLALDAFLHKETSE